MTADVIDVPVAGERRKWSARRVVVRVYGDHYTMVCVGMNGRLYVSPAEALALTEAMGRWQRAHGGRARELAMRGQPCG